MEEQRKQEIKHRKSLNGLTSITRSFTYKLNIGNFESRDFFCSQSAEVPLGEAEKTSEALYKFCKEQVIKSVNEYTLWRKSLIEQQAICERCGGRIIYSSSGQKIINGLCERCAFEYKMQLRENGVEKKVAEIERKKQQY
jgi:hypothetical protein